MTEKTFGRADASYLAAGQRAGLEALVSDFYQHMRTLPEAKKIFGMHTDPLPLAEEKLVVFLSAWLGGPKNYASQFGPIRLPRAHAHLDVGAMERDAWLMCMQRAVDGAPWTDEFKRYFMSAIRVPAERVHVVSQATRGATQKNN